MEIPPCFITGIQRENIFGPLCVTHQQIKGQLEFLENPKVIIRGDIVIDSPAVITLSHFFAKFFNVIDAKIQQNCEFFNDIVRSLVLASGFVEQQGLIGVRGDQGRLIRVVVILVVGCPLQCRLLLRLMNNGVAHIDGLPIIAIHHR